jgi:hypothetical protein
MDTGAGKNVTLKIDGSSEIESSQESPGSSQFAERIVYQYLMACSNNDKRSNNFK